MVIENKISKINIPANIKNELSKMLDPLLYLRKEKNIAIGYNFWNNILMSFIIIIVSNWLNKLIINYFK